MSNINSVTTNSPIQQLTTKPIRRDIAADAIATRPSSRIDKVEISGVSHLLAALKTNDIRADKVADIRAQIEAGNYDDTDHKLDAAADRLLDELMG
jgi:anti-sigma28 factor (negative regulator of flagellin synthesis)